MLTFHIFDFFSETTDWILTKFEGSKNSTWRPLPILYFSDRLENQDGHPGLWLAENFFSYVLKMEQIFDLFSQFWQNLSGSDYFKTYIVL